MWREAGWRHLIKTCLRVAVFDSNSAIRQSAVSNSMIHRHGAVSSFQIRIGETSITSEPARGRSRVRNRWQYAFFVFSFSLIGKTPVAANESVGRHPSLFITSLFVGIPPGDNLSGRPLLVDETMTPIPQRIDSCIVLPRTVVVVLCLKLQKHFGHKCFHYYYIWLFMFFECILPWGLLGNVSHNFFNFLIGVNVSPITCTSYVSQFLIPISSMTTPVLSSAPFVMWSSSLWNKFVLAWFARAKDLALSSFPLHLLIKLFPIYFYFLLFPICLQIPSLRPVQRVIIATLWLMKIFDCLNVLLPAASVRLLLPFPCGFVCVILLSLRVPSRRVYPNPRLG